MAVWMKGKEKRRDGLWYPVPTPRLKETSGINGESNDKRWKEREEMKILIEIDSFTGTTNKNN